MNERSRASRVRTLLLLAGMVVVLAIGGARATWGQEGERPAPPAKMPPNSPDEPIRAKASMASAATFLDSVALDWTRRRKCGTCHTNYPYLVARPVLKEPATAAMTEIRGFFEGRVAHWDDAEKEAKPRWDAEVVSTAAALAMNDSATSGKLHPRTCQALDRVWTVQKSDGGFDWLKCGWPPLEHDDYFGAIVAALGVGHVPDGYAETPAALAGVKKLRVYFSKNAAPEFPPSRDAALGVDAGRGLDGGRRTKRHDHPAAPAPAKRRRLEPSFAGRLETARR